MVTSRASLSISLVTSFSDGTKYMFLSSSRALLNVVLSHQEKRDREMGGITDPVFSIGEKSIGATYSANLTCLAIAPARFPSLSSATTAW